MKILSNNTTKEKTQGIVTVEIPPSRRIIICGTKKFFVSFPKLVFSIRYEFSSKTQKFCPIQFRVIAQENNVYYGIKLPNINSSFVCLSFIGKKFETVEDMVKYCMSKFWTSRFYSLAGDGLPFRKLIEDWQKKTKTNPKWVPNLKVEAKEFSKIAIESIFHPLMENCHELMNFWKLNDVRYPPAQQWLDDDEDDDDAYDEYD